MMVESSCAQKLIKRLENMDNHAYRPKKQAIAYVQII